ncbi:uncharacterized protein LOC143914699 [Arctopsyche grandis]|uniref:uncharacterized protein LOC143914699 n=1 Tax=Arctopsyche grandis TaxID=121162 RepID=UPI00406D91FD
MSKDVEAPIALRDDLLQVIYEIFKNGNIERASMKIFEASEKGDNYSGKIYRVKSSSKDGKSISLIVKCALESEVMRQSFPINKWYQREIHAYSKILPTLYSLQDESHLPNKDRFYFAKYYDSITEKGKEAFIIADLAVDGYKMYNRQNPFDKQHLELVMKNLARFHATSFVLKQKNPKLFEQFSLNVARKLEFSENIVNLIDVGKKKYVDIIESAEVRVKVEENIKDFIGKFNGYLDYRHAEPYNVICHGDCWINNIMFKYER